MAKVSVPQTVRSIPPWIPLGVLGLILLIGLLVRAYFAYYNGNPWVDGVFYMSQTIDLVGYGRPHLSSFPPGWPLLMVPALAVLGLDDPMAPLRAAQITNVLLGSAFLLLTYIAISRRAGRWAGVLAALVLMVLPENIILSRVALSEMSFTCLLLGAWIFLQKDRPLVTGLFLGYAYLVRPEALLIAVGLGLADLWKTRKLPWRMALGVAVFLLPYVIFLRVEGGTWTLSAKDSFLGQAAEQNPGWSYAQMVGRNIWTLTERFTGLVGWPIWLGTVLGLAVHRSRYQLFFLPLLVLPLFSFDMQARFTIPYLPFCFLAIADAWDWLKGRLPEARVRLASWAFLGCLVVGFGGAVADDIKTIPYNYESFPGLKDAGLWLRPRVNHETKVASYKPYPSFWAGCRFIKTPDEADAVKIVDAVRRQGAQYLVVNVHLVKYHVAGLEPLLVSPLPENLARRLTLLKMETDRANPYQNTAIYRINNPIPIRR